jgi:pilus assembly protein Flp/PilA
MTAIQCNTGIVQREGFGLSEPRSLAKGGETQMLTSLFLRLRELLNREEGQGMVEYALILVLIAVVVIVVLIILGNQVKNVFCNISGGLSQ